MREQLHQSDASAYHRGMDSNVATLFAEHSIGPGALIAFDNMSCHTKETLENMLEDVVNALNLSDGIIEKHGPLGTPPAELVREVLARKDLEIRMLKQGFVDLSNTGLGPLRS